MTVQNIQFIQDEVAETWRDVRWVESVGSTNAELLADGQAGDVLIADAQTAGRGRMGRTWVSPKGAQLCLSVLVDAEPVDRVGLLPLATGLAVADVIPEASLKWPNDVLLGGRKLAGILAEADLSGEAPRAVLGVGVNVAWRREDLPVETATSLNLEGVDVEWDQFTVDLLLALGERIRQWREGDAQLLEDYRAVCSTIGRAARLERAGGDVEGVVDDINDAGEIVIDGTAYSAGDVTHLRPAE
ncbi:biotin--[acetyl-CoA-carboxylase] ligase [Corynebacterium sp. UBA2622]|uniref:biotin--[acetyl-CoA-carboxylase] ligase n=1 Tax=Corynebacterium sp. UBA2622 TaxID=1946393 RepID=UPI0025C135D7|nr:biotin--[acetyl-CoA-carboxylase] ligase [Corynebacterium sp. UBA2622]